MQDEQKAIVQRLFQACADKALELISVAPEGEPGNAMAAVAYGQVAIKAFEVLARQKDRNQDNRQLVEILLTADTAEAAPIPDGEPVI